MILAIHDRFQLKVASAQMVLNFASFLEENKYFEDAFRVCEKVGDSRRRSGVVPVFGCVCVCCVCFRPMGSVVCAHLFGELHISVALHLPV